jgi:hypothetical protein
MLQWEKMPNEAFPTKAEDSGDVLSTFEFDKFQITSSNDKW